LFPFLKWWPRVDRSTLKADALAGLIGAVVVLRRAWRSPRSPGFHPSTACTARWCRRWSRPCRLVSAHGRGPTNPVSLMVFAVLSPIAVPMTPHYIQLALTLALMSGIIMLALGLLRFGSLVNFMSSSVVVGFTAALGVFISGASSANFLASSRRRQVSPNWCSERSGTLATPGRGWFSWRPPRSLSARSRTACCRGSRRC